VLHMIPQGLAGQADLLEKLPFRHQESRAVEPDLVGDLLFRRAAEYRERNCTEMCNREIDEVVLDRVLDPGKIKYRRRREWSRRPSRPRRGSAVLAYLGRHERAACQ
jgi:hypothetical protein